MTKILRTCGDIVLLKMGKAYTIYNGDTEYLYSPRFRSALKEFNNLVGFSEYQNNEHTR